MDEFQVLIGILKTVKWTPTPASREVVSSPYRYSKNCARINEEAGAMKFQVLIGILKTQVCLTGCTV